MQVGRCLIWTGMQTICGLRSDKSDFNKRDLMDIFEELSRHYHVQKNQDSILLTYTADDDTLFIEFSSDKAITVCTTKKGYIDVSAIKYDSEKNLVERIIANLFDSAGFTDQSVKPADLDTLEYLKSLQKNVTKELIIVTFGEKFKSPKSMEIGPVSRFHRFRCNKVFDSRHINSARPKGANLHELRGTDEIVQKCIEAGSGYVFVMECIIKYIESLNDSVIIGIYCTSGHHRSVAVGEILKNKFYPDAKLIHLHIGTK